MTVQVPLTLSFGHRSLERLFQRYYRQRYRNQLRMALLLGTAGWITFGLLDGLYYPEVATVLWRIRYLYILPVILVLALCTFTRLYWRIGQLFVAVAIVVGGLGVIAMILAIPSGRENYYFVGLMLILFINFTIFRLRFIWASLAGLVLLVAFNATILATRAMPDNEIIMANFFLVGTNLFGMVAAYLMEYDSRRSFLLMRLLSQSRRRLRGINLNMERINARLDSLARTDELTGLANRRSFYEDFEREWKRARRYGGPITAIMVDIDHFKEVNDRYGHQTGDEYLRRVAGILAGAAKRAGDLVARLGGEEFVLVLPGTTASEAALVAERLRRELQELGLPNVDAPTCPKLTISAGVASLRPGDGHTPDDLIQLADKALYRAKEEGRNRVVCLRE